MYKVYIIGRKGGICSLVLRQEGPLVSVDRGVRRNLGEGEEERGGSIPLCRQRGEKEFGGKEKKRGEGASLCVDREVRRNLGGRRRREGGGIPLCRQRGEKESGRKEDDWKPREFCLQPFVGFTSARCTNALIHTYISVCNHAYYRRGGEGR